MHVLQNLLFAVVGTVGCGAPLQAQQLGPADVPATPFVGVKQLAIAELATIAGEADLSMEIRAQNNSVVSNNRVDGNSVTGTIGFDAQSFQNLNGLAVVSANTGNNVSINSSLNVNVSLTP